MNRIVAFSRSTPPTLSAPSSSTTPCFRLGHQEWVIPGVSDAAENRYWLAPRHRRASPASTAHGRAPRRRPQPTPGGQRVRVHHRRGPRWNRIVRRGARPLVRPSRCPRCLFKGVGWLAYASVTPRDIFGDAERSARVTAAVALLRVSTSAATRRCRWPSCVEFLNRSAAPTFARLLNSGNAVSRRRVPRRRGLARESEGALAKHFGLSRLSYTTAVRTERHHCGESFAARHRWMHRGFSSRLPIPPRTSRRLRPLTANRGAASNWPWDATRPRLYCPGGVGISELHRTFWRAAGNAGHRPQLGQPCRSCRPRWRNCAMRLTVRRRRLRGWRPAANRRLHAAQHWAPGVAPVRPASGALHLTDVHASSNARPAVAPRCTHLSRRGSRSARDFPAPRRDTSYGTRSLKVKGKLFARARRTANVIVRTTAEDGRSAGDVALESST